MGEEGVGDGGRGVGGWMGQVGAGEGAGGAGGQTYGVRRGFVSCAVCPPTPQLADLRHTAQQFLVCPQSGHCHQSHSEDISRPTSVSLAIWSRPSDAHWICVSTDVAVVGIFVKGRRQQMALASPSLTECHMATARLPGGPSQDLAPCYGRTTSTVWTDLVLSAHPSAHEHLRHCVLATSPVHTGSV